MTADAGVEYSFKPARPVAPSVNGVVPTLAVIALAAVLTDAVFRASGERTSVFLLAAAVGCTWAWGARCGILVVVFGSLVTLHLPFDPVDQWDFGKWEAWLRLALFASIGAGFVVLVHELRARSRTLAESVAKLETVLELAPVGIAIVEDADVSSPARVNGSLARMLGVEERLVPIEHDGERLSFRSDGLPLPVERRAMHEAMAMHRLSDRQDVETVNNGHRTHMITQAAPLLDEHGETRGAVATYVDVTEERERERQLIRANHAKDEFLGMVSHELNTPLTIIRGNAEVLLRLRPEPDDIGQALYDIRAAAEQMANNVRNLLAIAKMGNSMPGIEPVALRPLLSPLIEARRAQGRRIDMRCGDIIALAAPKAVEQVMDNLLCNAEKYGPPDSAISVTVEEDGSDVLIMVRDQGSGLLEDEVDAVFEPFYRSPRTRGSTGGMGLGLSVCRQMVTAMGGRVWARNRDAGGSEFGFSLPAARTDDGGQSSDA